MGKIGNVSHVPEGETGPLGMCTSQGRFSCPQHPAADIAFLARVLARAVPALTTRGQAPGTGQPPAGTGLFLYVRLKAKKIMFFITARSEKEWIPGVQRLPPLPEWEERDNKAPRPRGTVEKSRNAFTYVISHPHSYEIFRGRFDGVWEAECLASGQGCSIRLFP